MIRSVFHVFLVFSQLYSYTIINNGVRLTFIYYVPNCWVDFSINSNIILDFLIFCKSVTLMYFSFRSIGSGWARINCCSFCQRKFHRQLESHILKVNPGFRYFYCNIQQSSRCSKTEVFFLIYLRIPGGAKGPSSRK